MISTSRTCPSVWLQHHDEQQRECRHQPRPQNARGPRLMVTLPHAARRTHTRWGPPRQQGDDVAEPTVPLPVTPATTAAAMTPAEPTEPWTLRFDGACRRNPGPGGAGAALFDPSGAVVWTCSHYLPSSKETNNTAEYTALLLGVQSALHHGATRLLIEGDSNLVLAQVQGTFGCTNARLRQLRNRVRYELRALGHYKLKHIDRKANAHADRLANRALDQRRINAECSPHARSMMACLKPTAATTAGPTAPAPRFTAGDRSARDGESKENNEADIEAEIAARDGGEVFPTLPIGPNSAPARQPRLRIRQLTDEEHDTAAAALQTFAEAMSSRIADADSWMTGEGYISAIPNRIRELLQPFAVAHRGPPKSSSSRSTKPWRRPPRVTRDQREHRLDEAIDAMEATQSETPGNQKAVRKARRRVGRVRASAARQQLRQAFARDESKCVEGILKSASADTAVEEHPEACPIDGEELHRHFTGTNTPRTTFDYGAASGEEFRATLSNFQSATETADAFEEGLTLDEVEGQLTRAAKSSSPGHDGIGYDVYRRFATQLLPLPHATFQFCWLHRRVPALWKVGIVRLIHKKGDPMQPANWRPICLQPAIYKLYSGLLARRLSKWLETNERLPMAQKGFRAFNGCHEHNFMATTLLDQTRRKHRRLYQVWYDLRNAFGSLPQPLMWHVLRRLGVERGFIARCQDIYSGSSFVVANAADGATEPVRQEVGVYQGCPLSPLLFIAALVPLVRRLEQLDDVGVPLAEGIRPCTTAYGDDLKVFSDSAAGIKRCHGVVARFLK